MNATLYKLILSKLVKWGYLAIEDALRSDGPASKIFTDALIRYKERWAKYGVAGANMESITDDVLHLMERRFCSCPDVLPIGGGSLRGWTTTKLTWFDKGVQVGNLSFGLAQKFTIDRTAEVCGMRMAAVNTPQSNIISYSKYLDGRGKALAQAQLPNPGTGPSTQLFQEYDYSETNLSQHAFNMVVLHETGHTLGLSHDSDSREVEVMDPYLNATLTRWQPKDIENLVNRYGSPSTPTPSPGVPDGNTGGDELVIKITGDVSQISIPGYRVSKIGG